MLKSKNKFKGYIYLLPALIILAVFVFYPIINTIIFSFDETKASGFVFGFGSYKYLFQDKRFIQSLINTVIYAAIVPALSVFISLLIANALANIKNEKVRGIFQSIYFLPYVTSLVAIGIVWSWLFNSEYGIINFLLGKIGISPINWINLHNFEFIDFIIFDVLIFFGFNILILTTVFA